MRVSSPSLLFLNRLLVSENIILLLIYELVKITKKIYPDFRGYVRLVARNGRKIWNREVLGLSSKMMCKFGHRQDTSPWR